MSSKPVVRLKFLDEDHVLGLLKHLLCWSDLASRAAAKAFFAPEVPPDVDLEQVSEALLKAVDLKIVTGGDADILVTRRATITPAILAATPSAKFCQRLGRGAAHRDARGIAVSNLPRLTLEHVADHTLMLMLMLCRKCPGAIGRMRNVKTGGTTGDISYNWVAQTGVGALSGNTLGIVGMGEIGQLVATRAAAFGMSILYADHQRLPELVEQTTNAQHTALTDLLVRSQFISLHVPPDEKPLIGAAEIALMRQDAVIINTARGALIDETSLVSALKAGRIAGAGLDVHAVEPRPASDPLFSLENVVLTPHLAGGSRLGVLTELAQICDNLLAVIQGKQPRHGHLS